MMEPKKPFKAISSFQQSLIKPKIDSRPRGPKPQVCDLCQIRKVKCDKTLPRCFLCQKVNKPCTYDRVGFLRKPSGNSKQKHTQFHNYKWKSMSDFEQVIGIDSPSPKDQGSIIWSRSPNGTLKIASIGSQFLRSILQTSLMQFGRSQLYIDTSGNYYYSGPSLATHYFASNSKLFVPVLNPVISCYFPETYNKSIEVEVTNTLVSQLIELYFAYLNSFFPLVDPSSFYSQLNKKNYSKPFSALLSMICLAGASFYPNRTLARIIASIFSKRVKEHFKQIYLYPTLTTIQALLLAAYHISSCEEDSIIENSRFFLGQAKRMLEAMGLPHKPPHYFESRLSLKVRMHWMIYCGEAVIATCFGLPIMQSINSVDLPSATALLTSLNYTCPSIFIVKEIMELEPDLNAQFFRELCIHCRLVNARVELSKVNENAEAEPFISKLSLRNILSNSENATQSKFQKSMANLEHRSLKAFHNLPNFNTKYRTPNGLSLPNPTDIHYSQIAIFYFSLLIDINRPFIRRGQEVREIPIKGRSLPLAHYNSGTPLERTILATFFGCQIFIDMRRWYNEVGIPYTWYCAVQFSFMSLYMIKTFPKHHWVHSLALRNATFLFALFEDNSNRWAVIRDAYFILKPFMEELVSEKDI